MLIADDEALIRAGFKVLVDSAPGLTVVGEASDGVQAVSQARALRPDVVLKCCLAGPPNVDGLGKLACAPRAAAELAQDVPGLELRGCSFSR